MRWALYSIVWILAFSPASLFAQLATDFTVTDVTGNRHNLYADYLADNKVVVLFFMHSANVESNALAFDLQLKYADWGSGLYDVQFIGITARAWDNDESVSKFNRLYRVKFPLVSADGGALDVVENYMGEDFFLPPVFVMIKPDSSVIHDIKGEDNWATLDAIEEELGNSGAVKPFVVHGEIYTDELPVPNVDVNVKGVQNEISYHNESRTDEYGYYEYSFLNHPSSPRIEFAPVKDKDYRNGVSTLDMVNIHLHLLGAKKFESPYDYIRADINASGNVSALDIISLRKLLLEIDTVFPNQNTSWRFIPKDYQFTNSEDPLAENFPESITIQDIEKNISPDFIALKVGDLNASADPHLLKGKVRSNQSSTIKVNANEQNNLAQYEFFLEDIHNISGMQFGLRYDPTLINLHEVQNGLISFDDENYSFYHEKEPGEILFSILTPMGQDIDPDRPLFILNFNQTSGEIPTLFINDEILLPELYNERQDIYTIELEQINLENTEEYSLDLELFPNPTSEKLNLRISKSITGKILIYNMAGAVIHSESVQNMKQHTIEVNSLLPGSYHLAIWEGNAITRKFTFLKH